MSGGRRVRPSDPVGARMAVWSPSAVALRLVNAAITLAVVYLSMPLR